MPLVTNNIGNNMRKLRKRKGVTQGQLARAVNVTAQAVSKWETCLGCPDIALLPVIAEYFGVSLDTLFGVKVD